MRQVGVAMLEGAGAGAHGFEDIMGAQHRADGLIASTQRLGDRNNIRAQRFLLTGKQTTGSPHPTHDFIEN